MKTIILVLFISIVSFAQVKPQLSKEDSVKVNEIITKYNLILKEYQSVDSLQIKRQGILQFLQGEYSDILKKYQQPEKQEAKKEGK